MLTGHIECIEGLTIQLLRVTVTQDSVGARAEKQIRKLPCTGEGGQFETNAVIRGKQEFAVPATAQVCGLAVIGLPGLIVDSHQWCKDDSMLLPE